MLTIKRNEALLALVVLFLAAMACGGNQSPSQDQSLQATISALQTQIASSQGQPQAMPTIMSTPLTSQDQQLQATLAALQTQIAQPTPAPTVPTITPIPSPTFLPDTAPNTILEVGETWRQGGVELTLVEAYYDYIPTGPGCWDCGPPGAYLTFKLTNRKSQQITVQYNLKDCVSAVDNLGRHLEEGVTSNAYLDSFETHTVLMASGESIYLAGWGGYGQPGLIILVDTTDTAVTEFTVTVSISSISNARWRVPVGH